VLLRREPARRQREPLDGLARRRELRGPVLVQREAALDPARAQHAVHGHVLREEVDLARVEEDFHAAGLAGVRGRARRAAGGGYRSRARGARRGRAGQEDRAVGGCSSPRSPLVRLSAQRTLRRETMRARVRTAVILGAGMGVRLAELGRAAPKGFLRLGARPIIAESLARLVATGIERVVIVTGHLGEFYENLARGSRGLVVTVENPRFHESGSLYSLCCARELL